MTARRALWAALGLASLPLVFLANTGCDKVVGLREIDNDHNALRCSCSCASSGNADLEIRAGSDDAEQTGLAMNLGSTNLDLGESDVGLRFDAAMIPAGATIQTATVQFVAAGGDSVLTTVEIAAELSAAAATFSTADDDLNSRVFGTSVSWTAATWNGGASGPAQRTPELKDLIQELVDLPDWSNASAIVLRFAVTTPGHRSAHSFNGDPARAPILSVVYDATVTARLPVCASAGVELDVLARITPEAMEQECARVQDTFQGLAEACGYPSPCTCEVFDVPDREDSFKDDVCSGSCPETLPDAMCDNFDPNAFTDCVAETSTVAGCEHFVAATNAAGASPVCVASGSPLALHMFGLRSQCDVAGTSHLEVGDREPEHDPDTDGTIEILGRPCPGGGCAVHPFFDLHMDNITFSVKFASDPTFSGLKASGRALSTATLDGVNATFGEDALEGTGSGRRFLNGLAYVAGNEEPLIIGLDWTAGLCDMTGNLVTSVDAETPDGLCDGDDATPCTADSPDCDGVGGPCVLESEDVEALTVDVALAGTLVNQPPLAAAGDDRTVECTSSAGATFELDGRASTDPDHNLALATWRRGHRVGALVSTSLATVQNLGVGGSQTYVLRVIDAFAQADEDETTVEVADTTAPVIACNAPAVLAPSGAPISFTASAADVCDDQVAAEITSFDCFTFTKKGRRIDKRRSCEVAIAGDTVTILDSGGIGDHIQWTVEATDDSGNSQPAVCEVVVAN